MKRCLFLLIFLCVGCSGRVSLSCSYSDINSIYGVKNINDYLVFKGDKLISFRRNINFSVYSDMSGSIRTIYKSMKKEGRVFKKFVGGKYRVSRSNGGVNMILTVEEFNNNNLSYIGIDVNDNYSSFLDTYESMGFSCK